jgi:5-methylcytosine-specific restriction endonuclease McrBC GTP-binding regulatory subunit McrB
MIDYGTETERKIAEITDACERYGSRSIIALAGVPGTGKSFAASIGAQRFASDPLMVREVQFHQSFSYEEFIEGMRIGSEGAVQVEPGIFLDWNQKALDDPEHRYVLLIEELTRANLAAVLGELMTYLEHRGRPFTTVYSRRPVFIASNLTLLATYNPTDRSAIDIDAALIRRLRIVQFPPSTAQLEEMLSGRSDLRPAVIEKLKHIFTECEKLDDYEHLMPFGHGIFADIHNEAPDLYRLWEERIRHLIRRPLVEAHPFAEVIEKAYPWRNRTYILPVTGGSEATA